MDGLAVFGIGDFGEVSGDAGVDEALADVGEGGFASASETVGTGERGGVGAEPGAVEGLSGGPSEHLDGRRGSRHRLDW